MVTVLRQQYVRGEKQMTPAGADQSLTAPTVMAVRISTAAYCRPFFSTAQSGSVHSRQSAPTNHFAASVLPFSW